MHHDKTTLPTRPAKGQIVMVPLRCHRDHGGRAVPATEAAPTARVWSAGRGE